MNTAEKTRTMKARPATNRGAGEKRMWEKSEFSLAETLPAHKMIDPTAAARRQASKLVFSPASAYPDAIYETLALALRVGAAAWRVRRAGIAK